MVRAAGLAGWEFLPLPRSNGAAFPFFPLYLGTSLVTLKDSSTACADVAHGQHTLPKLGKLQNWLLDKTVSP
jgi:hypothetical protein